MRRVFVLSILSLAVALMTAGCSAQETFSAADIETIQFSPLGADGGRRSASSEEVARFVAAYHAARPTSEDGGTTAPARIDVTFKNGEHLTVWGGGQAFQTIERSGRQSTVQGEELGRLLAEIAATK